MLSTLGLIYLIVLVVMCIVILLDWVREGARPGILTVLNLLLFVLVGLHLIGEK